MKILATVSGVLILIVAAYLTYAQTVTNPRVVAELRNNPTGERANRAMLVTLQNGQEYPVNYLHEGDQVFMGIDGRWWREFVGAGTPVTLFIKGKTYRGHAVTVLDQPEYTRDVFSRLRPTAPTWLPDWLNGKLVVISLE